MSTTVVNVKDPAFTYDVFIGRPSKWGNPFVIGRDGTRAEVVAKYTVWIAERPDLVLAAETELRGKVLGCFCAPKLCHGDVLRGIADARADNALLQVPEAE